jgi:hypothetical protein
MGGAESGERRDKHQHDPEAKPPRRTGCDPQHGGGTRIYCKPQMPRTTSQQASGDQQTVSKHYYKHEERITPLTRSIEALGFGVRNRASQRSCSSPSAAGSKAPAEECRKPGKPGARPCTEPDPTASTMPMDRVHPLPRVFIQTHSKRCFRATFAIPPFSGTGSVFRLNYSGSHPLTRPQHLCFGMAVCGPRDVPKGGAGTGTGLTPPDAAPPLDWKGERRVEN